MRTFFLKGLAALTMGITSAKTRGRYFLYNTLYIFTRPFGLWHYGIVKNCTFLFTFKQKTVNIHNIAKKTRQTVNGIVRLDIRTNRLTASHSAKRLMLLGSPPDMVHGAPSYSACPTAYPRVRLCLVNC